MERYRFTCPNCSEKIIIDKKVKDSLKRKGCIRCGTSISEECFEDIEISNVDY